MIRVFSKILNPNKIKINKFKKKRYKKKNFSKYKQNLRFQSKFFYQIYGMHWPSIFRFYSIAINQTLNHCSELSRKPLKLEFDNAIIMKASKEDINKSGNYFPKHISLESGNIGVSGVPNQKAKNKDQNLRLRRGDKKLTNMVKEGINLGVKDTNKRYYDHDSIITMELTISLWETDYFLEKMKEVYEEEFEYRLFRYEHKGEWIQEENCLTRVLRVFQKLCRKFGDDGQTLILDPITNKVRLRRKYEDEWEGVQASPEECFIWVKERIDELSLPVVIPQNNEIVPYGYDFSKHDVL